jgi:signal transduction histidine kinase
MKLSAHTRLAVPLLIGIAVSIALLVVSELSHRRLIAANQALATSMQTQAVANEVLALVVDAETAQRGFLITERRSYLDPYLAALPRVTPKIDALAELVRDTPEQRARVDRLRELIAIELDELDASLSLARSRGAQAARQRMQGGGERVTMGQIRRVVDDISNSERAQLVELSYRWNQDIANSRFGLAAATALNVVLLTLVYLLASREFTRRERMRLRLVQQQKLLEAQVRTRTAELSDLSSDLQRVQEIEKSQLARELHDEMGSILVSAKMDVSWARNRIAPSHPEAAQKLQRALHTLDDGVEVKRRIIEDLRPALLDNLGLGAAISWHAEQMSERSGLQVSVLVPENDEPLPGHIAIALFRVVQEALTNVVRHAKAGNAWVFLERSDAQVHLQVRDDGTGLPPARERAGKTHGIMSMRQRILGVGGEFEMRADESGGTVISVRVPLDRPSSLDALPNRGAEADSAGRAAESSSR